MLENIRNTLNHVKVPRSSDEFFVKKLAMLMLVNGESKEQSTDMSIPQAAKLMGIHKRNFYLAKRQLQWQVNPMVCSLHLLVIDMMHGEPTSLKLLKM